MRIRKLYTVVVAAVTLFCVAGCCESNPNAARQADGQPVFLDGSTGCPPPPAPKTRPLNGGSCEVKGDLVYNLGQGAISNSNAVKLAGGLEAPKKYYIPGGVGARCTNPVPDSYREAVKRNEAEARTRQVDRPVGKAISNSPCAPVPVAPVCPPAAPAPAVPSPAPAAPAEQPWEPGVAGSGYCAPVACPAPTDTAIVCAPGGENVSECFILSEDELRAGPEVLVPRAEAPAVPETQTQAAQPAEVKIEPEKQVEAPQVTIPPLSAATEVAPEPAPIADAAPSAKVEHLPPVPEVTDMERAAEAILTSETGKNSIPEVQLPPSL